MTFTDYAAVDLADDTYFTLALCNAVLSYMVHSRFHRFSNAVLQALLVLLRKKPPSGHKLLVIGTSSNETVLGHMGLLDCFSKIMHVDTLTEGSQVGWLDTVPNRARRGKRAWGNEERAVDL